MNCSICNRGTIPIGPADWCTGTQPKNWEHLSTMALLKWKAAWVHLRYCLRCRHSMISPKFDTAMLYRVGAAACRQDWFEKCNPGKSLDTPLLYLSKASNEFYRLARLSRLLKGELLGENVRILDWGVSKDSLGQIFGHMLEMIRGRGWVEVQSYNSDQTIEHEPLVGKFDIVLCSHVLEHTHEPIRVIKEAMVHLLPGGQFLCEVPDERYVIVRSLLKGLPGLHYHVAHFSPHSLKRALQAAGLINVKTKWNPRSSYHGNRMMSICGVGRKA